MGLFNLSTLKEVTEFIYDSLYFHSSSYFDSNGEDLGFNEAILLQTRIGGNEVNEVMKGGSWGIIEVSPNGFKEILPSDFERVMVFNDYFIVFQEGKCGAYGRGGKMVIPLNYNYLDFSRTLNCFVANIGDGTKVQNSDWFDDFHYAGGKWGLLSEKGEILIPLEFEYFRPKPNKERENTSSIELIKVGNEDKFGLIDLKGKFRIPMV